jgi:hypothetical protein
MSQGQPLPVDVAVLLNDILDLVRETLDTGKAIIPTWFVVSRELRGVQAVPVPPFHNDRQKAIAGRMIREMIAMMQTALPIDCVVFICEGWGVTRKNDEAARNLRETGNVRDEPDAVDVIMISIETYDGSWMAQPQVFQKDKRRELGPIELLDGEGFIGRMTSWLPPKPGTTRQ